MKKQMFWVTAVAMALCAGIGNTAWAEEKQDGNKNGIFSITPAAAFSWYPYANFHDEVSTNTEVDLNNFGMSVIMGLKLFDKVGTYLNLKIDDPAFQKLVDVAGYVTAYYFLLKFNYHAFGGIVTWTGNTPNPISGEVYNFRNQWSNVSLLFRVDQLTLRKDPNFFTLYLWGMLSELGLVGEGNLGAIGIGYARYDMPLEYRVRSDSRLSNPGFGLVKGEAWGFSVLWDTLTWYMELPASSRSGLRQFIWIYVDWFYGLSFIGKGETDEQAIAWMSNANKGIPIDGNIKPSYGIFKGVLGLQHVWDVGEKGRIGLAVGAELLEETIKASNNDIDIQFWSWHIGPAVRVSARW